jgi:aryl-alcohol dehydrogenase
MNSLKVSSGESIAIFGTGAVGLAAVMAARLVGAAPIIGVDIRPKRLQLALKLGATHVINSRRQDVAARIAEITSSGIDYVVETTANPKMRQLAIDVLNPHGIVALLTGESGADLPEGRKTLGIIEGDAVPQIFIPKLIELYRTGQFPFDRLVKFYDLSDINRAIADAKRGDTIKPILRISEA